MCDEPLDCMELTSTVFDILKWSRCAPLVAFVPQKDRSSVMSCACSPTKDLKLKTDFIAEAPNFGSATLHNN